jgi:hypothetical protein
MYNADQLYKEVIDGLHHFLDMAEANKRNGFICYRANIARIRRITPLQGPFNNHIFSHGFIPKYIYWTSREEKGLIMEENEEEECEDNFSAHAGFGAFDDDTAMEEAHEGEVADDDPTNDFGLALHDAREDCESKKERMKFQQMLEDHQKLLYPGCEDGLKKLGGTLELLQWKATHGVSDKGFGELLKHLKNMLP